MTSAVSHRNAQKVALPSPSEDRDIGEETRDIDGLPLRDHKKVDLKLILGHTPEVEDEDDESTSGEFAKQQRKAGLTSFPGLADDIDEYEYGYSDDEGGNAAGDDDDDDEGRTDAPVKRKSSLRATHAPGLSDASPSSKKEVRFADALGLGLAAVKDLLNADEPPDIPHSALKDLRIRKKRSKLGEEFRLTLTFDQPSSDPQFMVRLQRQKVMLENCVASDRDLAVSGVIRVVSISYEKRVTVRYTLDRWNTFREIPTTYVPNSNDGATDRFMFVLHLPVDFGRVSSVDGEQHLEFAIQYLAGEGVHWDSNNGNNYIVDCTPCTVGRSQLDPSRSEGEFMI